MKRYFGIIVALVTVVVAIVWAYRKWNDKTAESAREQSVQRIRGDYLERVAWMRNVPETKAYNDEITTFLRWYFKEVNDHLNKFGGNRNFNDYILELEEKAKKNPTKEFQEYESPTKDRSSEKKAVYEYTRKVFDQLKGGTYNVYWTGTSQGIRLDIVTASTERIGGEDKIHMPLVVWGLPREEHSDEKNVRRITTNGSFHFNWRLLDEKGKLIAEIPGDGVDSRVDWPERYVKFFPPSVVLGHWDIDKVPQEAKVAEISITIGARSPTGGDVNATYAWTLDVPAEWKLAPGEAWKGAQESIRPEEEIDPAKAPKPDPKAPKK